MGKSKKKIDVFGIVVFCVLALSIVMVIVGVCIDWTTSTASSALGGSSSSSSTLSDWAKANSDAIKLNDKGLGGYGAMAAFAYITLALAALTAVVYVISKFANVKLLKWVLIALSALLAVSGVLAIALTYSFCKQYAADAIIVSTKTAPAAGAWLLSIFGIVGGAVGVVGALKK